MNKVIVIGCPGSGKSTFSKALHKLTGIPLFHLDMLYWNEDKTTVDRSVFLERLDLVLQQSQWIIDGNYASTMEQRMAACDTVIFLDYPTEDCLKGVRDRLGTPRSDLPWTETEADLEFERFIKEYNSQSRPEVLRLLCKYSHKEIYRFKSRSEGDAFLAGWGKTN